MLFEKIFSGGQSSKDMHTNQYAVGSVSQRTFSQRKTIEQGRSRIAAYRQSKLGWNVAPRGEHGVPKPQAPQAGAPPVSPPSPAQRTFQEPPSRNFNPYS